MRDVEGEVDWNFPEWTAGMNFGRLSFISTHTDQAGGDALAC